MSARNSPLPSLAGTKRKRSSQKKYYAVQVGKEPGVYDSWEQCLAQVRGQKGAVFKSFSSSADAKAFAEGNLIEPSPPYAIEPKFYAVAVGKIPGIYTDWASAQAQISGFKAPKYKKFASQAEAEIFVEENKVESANSAADVRKLMVKKSAPGMVPNGDHIARDKQGNSFELARGPLPPGAEDGFDPNIKLSADGEIVSRTAQEKSQTKRVPREREPQDMLRIYTDGSSLKNGQAGARAGVGVFFGPQNPNNVSEALKGTRQTNQRAELTAVQRALDIAPTYQEVTIYTDSKYAIDCVTNWYKNWIRNGWVNTKGKPVENRDLIQDIREKITERELVGRATYFVWVKGHAADAGNIAADRLAVQGALMGSGLSNESTGADSTKTNSPGESGADRNGPGDQDETEASWQLLKESMEADKRDAEFP